MTDRRIRTWPDTPSQNAEVHRRIRRLEDRVTEPTREPDPKSFVFSKAGSLASGESTSPPYEHPTGGKLLRARCILSTAGSTETVLRFLKNGVEIVPAHSAGGYPGLYGEYLEGTDFVELDAAVIPADQARSIMFFVGKRFGPNDSLAVQIVAAGAGAAGLTVRTDWGA